MVNEVITVKVKEYLNEENHKKMIEDIKNRFRYDKKILNNKLKELSLNNRPKVEKQIRIDLLKSDRTINEICKELEIDFKDKESVSLLEALKLKYT